MKSYCIKGKKKQTEYVELSGYKTAKNGRLMFSVNVQVVV